MSQAGVSTDFDPIARSSAACMVEALRPGAAKGRLALMCAGRRFIFRLLTQAVRLANDVFLVASTSQSNSYSLFACTRSSLCMQSFL